MPKALDSAPDRLVTVDTSPALSSSHGTTQKKKKRRRKPTTAHLKIVPQEREIRDQVRREAERMVSFVDRSQPLTKEVLRTLSEELLKTLGLDSVAYLGFTMVVVNNEFWREQLMAVDFSRRLLLLPHCLKHAEGCPADYDEFGLNCEKCGACTIADFKVTAEELGYKVLVAEGTPIVLKVIVSGYVDAVVGVACLNVLEKAIDKIIQAGVPSLAVPLLSSDCKNTSVDDDWVAEIIGLKTEPAGVRTRSYVPLLRSANEIFEEEKLEALSPRPRKAAFRQAAEKQGEGSSSLDLSYTRLSADPISSTEAVAYDFLARGGKRFRPFITLASYDALTGGEGTLPGTDGRGCELPTRVQKVAMAMEAFHKASLIHDDIEDDDVYRYGVETLHRRHGLPTALNVGDYMIGLGYRLVASESRALGAECAADILDALSCAHVRLAEGQGAELKWRDSDEKSFTPLDALKIYALKTAPAFEVALYAGLRLAGPTGPFEEMLVSFSRNLGVAFQILNDLKDWDGDDDNKLVAGGDVLAARPTLLLALALQQATPEDREILLSLIDSEERAQKTVRKVRRIFDRYSVFDKAEALVDKYRARTEAVADEVQPDELRSLLYFLIDNVLEREESERAGSLVDLQIVNMAVASSAG